MTAKKKKPAKKATPKAYKKNGAPYGNKNNEKYTLDIALSLFNSALKILQDDSSIITETELAFRCKDELSLPYRSYIYLRDDKFPLELRDVKKEIESTLEIRVMKSKDMYPGIAAMTLKNKHGWRDEKQLDLSGSFKVEIVDRFSESPVRGES
ncbi:hypothetical protein KAX97_14680 [candidate division WOR-3 bacterium]|nr:hypothetical protein [candidate division WOR-3 bacterium]